MPKIIRVFGSLHDLFFGDGWKDWTRVSIKNNIVKYVSGKERPQFKLDLIKDKAK